MPDHGLVTVTCESLFLSEGSYLATRVQESNGPVPAQRHLSSPEPSPGHGHSVTLHMPPVRHMSTELSAQVRMISRSDIIYSEILLLLKGGKAVTASNRPLCLSSFISVIPVGSISEHDRYWVARVRPAVSPHTSRPSNRPSPLRLILIFQTLSCQEAGSDGGSRTRLQQPCIINMVSKQTAGREDFNTMRSLQSLPRLSFLYILFHYTTHDARCHKQGCRKRGTDSCKHGLAQ